MELGRKHGDPDKTKEGSEQLKQMQSELVRFAKENHIVLDNAFWRSFNGNVKSRLFQKLNPGKIRKPTEGERRHMDSILEDNSNE